MVRVEGIGSWFTLGQCGTVLTRVTTDIPVHEWVMILNVTSLPLRLPWV